MLEDFSLEARQLKGENHLTSPSGAEVENGCIYSDNFTVQSVRKGEDLIILVQVIVQWWQ